MHLHSRKLSQTAKNDEFLAFNVESPNWLLAGFDKEKAEVSENDWKNI